MPHDAFAKDRLDRLHEVMAGHVASGRVPGLVTLVAKGDEVHADALGRLAVDGAPVRRDSIFRIASMTKPMTAVATLALVEECRLRLDDPVDGWLPEIADRRVLRSLESPVDDTVPAVRPISVRDLLTFRSGYGMVMAMPGTYPIQEAADAAGLPMGPPEPGASPSADEWLRRLGTLPLLHQPGARWHYNTGSDLLGVLIERVTGRPLDAVLRERIFDPLGMRDTGFVVPAADVDRLATAYWTDAATGELGPVFDEAAGGQWTVRPAFLSGAGGLVSTVDDVLAFSRMLLAGGRGPDGRVLAASSVAAMTTDQLTPDQKAVSGLYPGQFDDHGWGFGLQVVTRRTRPEEPVGAHGWDGGLGTSYLADPNGDVVTILLTQASFTSPVAPPVCRDFRTAAYAALA